MIINRDDDDSRIIYVRYGIYDVWKEIEGPVTFRRHFPGYYEADVIEQDMF